MMDDFFRAAFSVRSKSRESSAVKRPSGRLTSRQSIAKRPEGRFAGGVVVFSMAIDATRRDSK
jgi:hypothetical protein